MGEDTLWSIGNRMRLLKQSTVGDGGCRDDKEQVYTSVLTEVESKKIC